MKYYAVKVGRRPGIYSTWQECKAQVDGYPQAQYKKFASEGEALDFIGRTNRQMAFDDLEPYKARGDGKTLVAYVDGSFDKEDGSYSYGAVFIDGDDIKTF